MASRSQRGHGCLQRQLHGVCGAKAVQSAFRQSFNRLRGHAVLLILHAVFYVLTCGDTGQGILYMRSDEMHSRLVSLHSCPGLVAPMFEKHFTLSPASPRHPPLIHKPACISPFPHHPHTSTSDSSLCPRPHPTTYNPHHTSRNKAMVSHPLPSVHRHVGNAKSLPSASR